MLNFLNLKLPFKPTAPFWLFCILLLIGVTNIAHIYHTKKMSEDAVLVSKNSEMDMINDEHREMDLLFETGISVLDILAFILILYVRQKEKGELEELTEKERAAKLDAQMKAKTKAEIIKAKESFLIMFTHELKTPLNAIMSFSKYISKKTPDNEDGAKIKMLSNGIFKNGQNMLDTVSNLLEINKTKNGKIEIIPVDIVLEDMLQDIFEKYKILANETKTTTELISNANFPVQCCKFYLEHIVSNIYTNSLKYGRNKILVTINQKNPTNWSITIEDNGEGIKDGKLAMELFEQLDQNNLTRNVSGTGVGLYFCKYFSDLLHLDFDITRSSELGGAKITINKKENNDNTNS